MWSFTEIVTAAASIFVGKNMLIHLITIRERVHSSIQNFPDENKNFFASLARPLLKMGPSFGGKSMIERLERCAKNNIENECLYLILALCTLSGRGIPDNAITCTGLFIYSRCAHNLFMLFGPGTGIDTGMRSTSYSISFSCNLYMAVLMGRKTFNI